MSDIRIAQLIAAPPEPQFLGLDASLWINGGSIIVSSAIALLIAVWLTPRLSEKAGHRGKQEAILRTLVHTWQNVADPNFHQAIALIPLDFKGCQAVLSARESFLAGLSPDLPPPTSRAGGPIDAHVWA